MVDRGFLSEASRGPFGDLNAWCKFWNHHPSKSAKASRGRPSCPLSQMQKLCRATLAARRACNPPNSWGRSRPEAKGVEELVVDALDDLADACYPTSESLGPASLAAVALGRMDDLLGPIAFEPPPMVFGALKTLIGYVGSRGDRAYAREPWGFVWHRTAKKVCAIRWSAVLAAPKHKPLMTPEGSVAVSKLKPSYHPRLLDQPMCQRSPPAIHAPGACSPARASPFCPAPRRGSFALPQELPSARRKPR